VSAENLASAQCPSKVRVEDLRPFFHRQSERRRALDLSGAVDQDVYFPEAFQRRDRQRCKRVALANIATLSQSPSSPSLDFKSRFVDLLLSTSGGNNIRSRIREAEAQNAADPGCASHYHGRFVFQAQNVGWHSLFSFLHE
jgi:hypothetical protein